MNALRLRSFVKWSTLLFSNSLLSLSLSSAWASPPFKQAAIGPWDLINSRHQPVKLGIQSSDELTYHEFDWTQIEGGLTAMGWRSRAPAHPAATKNVKKERVKTTDADEQEYLLNTVPNGSPLHTLVRMSSPFGKRIHPIQKKIKMHKGVDFGVAVGTPVHSTAEGIVVTANNSNGSAYGKYIVVKHASGFSTLYAHLDSVAVTSGSAVSKGALLGKSGNTGRSTSAHLHYEIRYQNKSLDPIRFIQWSRENWMAIFNAEMKVPRIMLREQEA